jgi:hypothetical protein
MLSLHWRVWPETITEPSVRLQTFMNVKWFCAIDHQSSEFRPFSSLFAVNILFMWSVSVLQFYLGTLSQC